jgi:HK97 family phage prohead protease
MEVEDTEARPKRRKCVFPMQRLKLEEAAPDGRRRIEGYAAVFGNRDAYGDVITPGAFERTLREKPDVKVLYQHDTDQPIGKQESGHEDEFGLAVVGALTNTDLVTRTVVPLLEDEVITGLSIGYETVIEEYNSELKTWFLKDIDLWEWSPVTFPANELATVTQVKTLGDRGDQHARSVQRHTKSLIHELTGYFEKSDRRGALPSAELAELRHLLADDTHGDGAVSTVNVELIKAAYLQGANDTLAGVADLIS